MYNRVGDAFLTYSRAGHLSALADILPLGARAQSSRGESPLLTVRGACCDSSIIPCAPLHIKKTLHPIIMGRKVFRVATQIAGITDLSTVE